MIKRSGAVFVALFLALVATAVGSCTDDEGDNGDARPTVVVTSDLLGDVVSAAIGDVVDVVTLMPAGAGPHSFQASAQQAAETAQAQLASGELVIYKGEIKDNKGKTVIPGGKELGQTAIELEQMNWLAEGVMGSVG